MKSHCIAFSKSLSALALAVCSMMAGSQTAQAAGTSAVPVSFPVNLDAGHLRAGQSIEVRTLQSVILPDGAKLAKGTRIEGHVVAAEGFVFDATPYAEQKGSQLSLSFDAIEENGKRVPIHSSLRAMAAAPDVRKATTVDYANEMDTVGTLQLIGGTSFTPADKRIASPDGDTLAYQRNDGIFARLSENAQTAHGVTVHCAANATEQAVGFFSGDACGLYGFEATYLSENGAGSAAITLRSKRENVRIYRGSAALLELSLQ